MVLINPSSTGIQTAGTAYTITCIALKSASGFSQSPQVMWRNPNGNLVANGGGITLGNPVSDSLRTVQALTFNTLSTSEAGAYSCEATLSSSALTTSYQVNQSHTVSVSGMTIV